MAKEKHTGLGWYKGRWLGDMPKGEGGKSLGCTNVKKPEAKVMFQYHKSKRRKPVMFQFRTVIGNLRYAVYWKKKDVAEFLKTHSAAREVKP